MLSKIMIIIKKIKKIKKINRIFLILFWILLVSTLILKIIDNTLLDLGFLDGSFHLNFWENIKWYKKAFDPINPNKSMQFMFNCHPNLFWTFTQFTWLITISIFLFISLKILEFNEKNTPKWLKWLMKQKNISLITLYDMTVAVIFWSYMINDFIEEFNKDLFDLELIITILVHLLIPILFLIYSIIYLKNNANSSILKEDFLIQGMILSFAYMLYYVLIAMTWHDPYPITNLNKHFFRDIWFILSILFSTYLSLGFTIICHNWLLKQINKKGINQKPQKNK